MWRIAGLLLGACLSVPASAATLDAIEGRVLINHGKGFQPVAAATEARQGDLVMANPGASAKLIYSGGCVTEIKPGTVTTVRDDSHCPRAMLVGEDEDCDKYQDPKERDRCWCRKHRDDNTEDRQTYRARCGVVWWPYAAGAAILTAGAVLLITNNDDEDDNKKDDDDDDDGGGGKNP